MDQINKPDINDISIIRSREQNQLDFSMSGIYLNYKIFVMQDLL